MALTYRIKSKTTPGVSYHVDPNKGTCTCPGFQSHKHCKHIAQVVPELPGMNTPQTAKKAPETNPKTTSPKKTSAFMSKMNGVEQETMMREFDSYVLTRLSENFILRDFLYSTQADLLEKANRPSDDPLQVIAAGKALCSKVMEPLLSQFGKLWITFGYQSREVLEATSAQKHSRSSSPHQWDRGTYGSEIYARVDILPRIVEDGIMSKYDYAKWAMMNLDIDLLMLWEKSNIMCITIAPRPRRVLLEWVKRGKGDGGGNSRVLMGQHYWMNIWPSLPPDQRPVYGPSHTGGKMY